MRNHLVEHPAACPAAGKETPALIDHIVERYHDTYRRELPELVALAQKVERLHGTDPSAPHGLAQGLKQMVSQLEAHMRTEERVLFPAMARRPADGMAEPIAGMRHGHEAHERALGRIAAITHGFRLPAGACRSWTQLYAGTRKPSSCSATRRWTARSGTSASSSRMPWTYLNASRSEH
jgi:regulator of cell morphogenesis and NO signaling